MACGVVLLEPKGRWLERSVERFLLGYRFLAEFERPEKNPFIAGAQAHIRAI